MADQNTPPNADSVEDLSKNNADVAEKLKQQDISGKSMQPTPDTHTGDALDALLKDVQKDVEQDDEVAQKAKAEADAKAAEEKAAADKAAAEAGDPEKQAEKAAAEKANAEKIAAEKAKADELFKDTPQLPQGASPKSAEAFASVKIRAAQEISAREAKIAELEKAKTDLEAKLQNPVPPETEQELKSLREWRAKLDIDADPKFKETEKNISSAREFIYAQLRKSPKVDDAVIAEIKKHGGPDKVKLDNILTAIGDPTIQRLVESKIADIEHLKFNQEQAVAAAKENVKEYMTARQKEIAAGAVQHNVDTESVLKQHLPKITWLQRREIPAGADEATKKAVEAHNKFAEETNAHVKQALGDDSPEMRAVMILGMAKLLYVQPQYEAAQARIATLEKNLKEATDKIAAFKGASVSRLRESAAAPGGKIPTEKKDPNVNARTGDALDDIMKQVQEENARARQ